MKATDSKGFTLIELMIVVSIIGILSFLAVVSYQTHVRKARRTDALTTLLSMQQSEERYRAGNTTYGTLAQAWGGVSASPDGRYTLTITNVSATAYTLTATAASGNDQLNDSAGATSCATLSLAVSNGVETRTPAVCW